MKSFIFDMSDRRVLTLNLILTFLLDIQIIGKLQEQSLRCPILIEWKLYISVEEICMVCKRKNLWVWYANLLIQKLNWAIISALAFLQFANSCYLTKLHTTVWEIIFSISSTNDLKRDFDLTL